MIIHVMHRTEGKIPVECFRKFECCGFEFGVHKDLTRRNQYAVSELSTGYLLATGDATAGNGNYILKTINELIAYCKEWIPKTEWLPGCISRINNKGGNK